MSALDDPGLLIHPPAPLRRPLFWITCCAFALLLAGLLVIALPSRESGPVLWAMSASYALRRFDVIGAGLMLLGSGLTWIAGAIWQWQQTR